MDPLNYTISDMFRRVYNKELRAELQVRTSRLESRVTIVSEVGRSFVGSKIGKGSDFGTEIVTALGDTNPTGINFDIRHIYAKQYKEANILDRNQMLNVGDIGNQATAQIRANHLAVVARRQDKTILEGARGPVKCGQDGLDTVTLPDDNTVAVDFALEGDAVNTNLTPVKLSELIRLLSSEEVTGQNADQQYDIFLAVGASQIQALQNNPLIMTNTMLYAELGGLREGQVCCVLGVQLIKVWEKLLIYDPVTKIRECIGWIKPSVYLNLGEAAYTLMDILPGKNHATQFVTYWQVGAGRMDEVGVYRVMCDESRAA